MEISSNSWFYSWGKGHCRQSARERLNDNYRALFQSALTNKQWVEALKSLLGAVTSDFSGSIIWLWRKIQRKLQRKISKFHNVS